MPKCRVDGCNRSKELSPDGFCQVCVIASVMRSAGTSAMPSSQSSSPSMNQTGGDPVNFPPLNHTNISPSVDFSKMESMAEKLNAGEDVDHGELLKSVFGMVFGVAKCMGSVDQVRSEARANTDRIKALEDKVGGKDEVALSLGIVILNLPPPPPGTSELEYARAAVKEVNAQGVNPQTDVTKAIRVGFKADSRPGANDGKLGKVEIEVSSAEVRAKIMKTKKCLESHSNEILRKIKIHNKKTQEQINQDFTNRQLLKMIPGGNAWYIAGNGQLRQQLRHQNPRPTGQNQQQHGPPPPHLLQQQPQSLFTRPPQPTQDQQPQYQVPQFSFAPPPPSGIVTGGSNQSQPSMETNSPARDSNQGHVVE